MSLAGSISAGVGGSNAGYLELTQGTSASTGTTSVKIQAPASVTSYMYTLPGSASTGFLLGTNSSNNVTISHVASSGSGSVCLTTSCSMTTPTLGAASATTINKLTITPPATGSTLTITDGKSVQVSNSLVLAGTDSTTMTFPSTSGAVMTADSTTTKTNLTLDAEGTGNTITISQKIWLPAAGCAGTTGALLWDTLATLAPTATCSAGTTETTMMRGTADFPDTDGDYSLQVPILLPDDWTGAVGIKFLYQTAATSGNTVWQAALSCRADAEVNDAAFNTADASAADAAKGTTLQINTVSIGAMTLTGCSAGELAHLKIFRNRTHASDTMTGVVSLIGAEVTMRRGI
jgi:hypothetical protein